VVDDQPERRAETRRPIELKVEYKRLNTFFADYTKNISRGGRSALNSCSSCSFRAARIR
jgi:hypothetical protein